MTTRERVTDPWASQKTETPTDGRHATLRPDLSRPEGDYR
jgi:hypothetical protein